MLRRSALHGAISAIESSLLALDFPAARSPSFLHFADRAVKSTSANPHFVCVRNAIACQCPQSGGTIVLGDEARDAGQRGGASPVHWARVRLQGGCAVGVFREGRLMLQCLGGSTMQSHDVSLRRHDFFSIMCGLQASGDAVKALAAVGRLLDRHCYDVEYMAEEILLSMKEKGVGCTSIVALVSHHSSGLPEPPSSSHS